MDELPIVNEINIKGFGVLLPKEDITPMEAAHIAILLVISTSGVKCDYSNYVKQHGLERHFQPMEEKQDVSA